MFTLTVLLTLHNRLFFSYKLLLRYTMSYLFSRNTNAAYAFFFTLVSLFFAQTLIAQPKPASATSNADPKAKAMLDKLKKQYDSYKTLEVSFELLIELPEQPKEKQKGRMVQQGEKYRVEINNSAQVVISDGATVWFMPNKNEVQITNADKKSSSTLSPKELMRIYEKKEYAYAVTGEGTENGKAVTYIEFKPTNSKKSEFSKIRMAIETKTTQIVSIKTFAKDNTHYTLTVSKITANAPIPNSQFMFDKAKYPNAKINDLRTE